MALSTPPWTERSDCSSPSRFSVETWTRPATGFFQIDVRTTLPLTVTSRGSPTFTEINFMNIQSLKAAPKTIDTILKFAMARVPFQAKTVSSGRRNQPSYLLWESTRPTHSISAFQVAGCPRNLRPARPPLHQTRRRARGQSLLSTVTRYGSRQFNCSPQCIESTAAAIKSVSIGDSDPPTTTQIVASRDYQRQMVAGNALTFQ